MLNSDLLSTLQARYTIGNVTQARQLDGGEWKTLFWLDTDHMPVVVSISHPSALVEGVAYEHAFLNYLHPRLPQIPAPIVARDGTTFFLHEGRIVMLLPAMPGKMTDRQLIQLPAARFLAHYHRVALAHPDRSMRPGHLAWGSLDWHANPVWHWPTIQALLETTSATARGAASRFWEAGGEWAKQIYARRAQIAQVRVECQTWITSLSDSNRPLQWAPIHDDFHDHNVLADGDHITALIDWDGCHPDWLLCDLSTATWEFCKDDTQTDLDRAQARAFLSAYGTANGPVTPGDFDLLVPLIHCRRIIEILSALQGIVNGDHWHEGDAEYVICNLVALENLDPLHVFG